MSRRPIDLLLEDILEAVEKTERYIEDLDYDAFEKDEKTVDAVVRNLEIIGEAANSLHEEFMTRHSDIEWNKIIGLRHRVVHEYFGVDLEIIWRILQSDLPEFKKRLLEIINNLSS